MKQWLVTVGARTKLAGVYRKLAEAGGVVDPGQKPQPLGKGEQVIEVRGPADLPERLKGMRGVKVYPKSEMTYY
jgi:hypothetical protein